MRLRELAIPSIHQLIDTCVRSWLGATHESCSHSRRCKVLRCGHPDPLPRVPDEADLARLLAACPETWEGKRDPALVVPLADSGLRISEGLRLRIEGIHFATRTLAVRGGKGAKDCTGYFGRRRPFELRAMETFLRKCPCNLFSDGDNVCDNVMESPMRELKLNLDLTPID